MRIGAPAGEGDAALVPVPGVDGGCDAAALLLLGRLRVCAAAQLDPVACSALRSQRRVHHGSPD